MTVGSFLCSFFQHQKVTPSNRNNDRQNTAVCFCTPEHSFQFRQTKQGQVDQILHSMKMEGETRKAHCYC